MHGWCVRALRHLACAAWDISKNPPARAEEVVGVPWPSGTGTFARGHADIISAGPTNWLVLTESGAPSLLQRLSEAFEGSAFRDTDASSG